jgi:hypothetical protein
MKGRRIETKWSTLGNMRADAASFLDVELQTRI